MDSFIFIFLKLIRKIYALLVPWNFGFRKPKCDDNADAVSKEIFDVLNGLNPAMIARFGSTEMACLLNYSGVKSGKRSFIGYITGKTPPWWWEKWAISNMHFFSGFFPATQSKINQFCEMMMIDMKMIDILGSWLEGETYFKEELKHCKKVNLELLNPYFATIPWTKALVGKKVLVVHPFTKTIEEQYKKRSYLFSNDLLPEFELKTIKAVQSIAGTESSYEDWFEALEHMKAQIDNTDYDICLIGAGAYGLPLAAHVKRNGKKAVHLGGSLQLLFGIRGKRWANPNYNAKYNYASLMNEKWVMPSDEERPSRAHAVEDGCYW